MRYGIRALRGRTGVVGAGRGLAGLLAGTPWACFPCVRPRLLRWGATDDEVSRPMPGDEAVLDPVMATTRAITSGAPVGVVWPWLAQIGQGRGGCYSYDWLENLADCDIHSAERILPEFQTVRVGDPVNLAPSVGLAVAAIEPGHLLVLRPLLALRSAAFDASWASVLEAIDQRTTRLVARFRVGGKPRVLLVPL